MRGIHRSPVEFPHKGQWHGALIFSLIYAWTNSWADNRDADDLRRHRTHYEVTVMPPLAGKSTKMTSICVDFSRLRSLYSSSAGTAQTTENSWKKISLMWFPLNNAAADFFVIIHHWPRYMTRLIYHEGVVYSTNGVGKTEDAPLWTHKRHLIFLVLAGGLYLDGLMQKRRNSSASAMLRLFCIKPSI